MQNIVITIARQYGSGGREIGVKVAELLGIKSYDRELITMAAQKNGMSVEALQNIDERATSSLLYTLAMGSSSYGHHTSLGFDMPVNDRLFVVQSELIREIAQKEDCVIVGRCADYVLREHQNVISIFVYADIEIRIKRIMETHGLSYDEAKDLVNKTDKRRINYYNFYTGRKWGKYDHYQMSIDSSLLGIDGSAKIIADIAKKYKELN